MTDGRLRLCLALTALAVPAPAAAQAGPSNAAEPTLLTPGHAVSDSIGPDTGRTYEIDLAPNQFVYAEVDQETVDVMVEAYRPGGTIVGVVDGSVRGPEAIRFDTEGAGRFRLVVRSARGEAGRYTVLLRRVEPTADTPAGRVDQLMAGYDPAAPGTVIAVTRNGELVFGRGYGLANVEYGLPLTPQSVFDLAFVIDDYQRTVPLGGRRGDGGGFVHHLRGQRLLVGAGPVEWPIDIRPEELQGGWRQAYIAPLLDEVGDPFADGWPHDGLRKYDRMSLPELLRSRGASKGLIELLRTDVLNLYDDGIDSLSALWFLRDGAIYRSMMSSAGGGVIEGGSDRLPRAFADRLSDRILYGVPVVRIEQHADGVEATLTRAGSPHRLSADYLICTVPFSVLGDIEVSPAFSAGKRKAIRDMSYSSITRMYLQVRRRFWEDAGESGWSESDLPVPRTIVHPINPVGDRPTRAVLEAHTGREQARRLAAQDEEARLAFAIEHLETLFPGVRDHVEGGTWYSWVNDPWVRGGYSSLRPGQLFELGPHIARREGRIFFAGEHTSTLSASIEGALESGERAAREVNTTSSMPALDRRRSP
jgi:monoamine oxidase